MTLAAQLLKTQQASLEVAVERAAPKGWKAGRTTVDGQTTQTSKAYAAEENPEHRQLLLDNGWDPERHKIVGPIRQSTWTAYLPKEYRSNSEEGAPVEDAFTFQAKAYRFNVVERGEGELSIDELVEVVNKYPAAFKPRAMMGVGEPEASFPMAQTPGQSTAGGGGIGSFAPSASPVSQAPQQCDTVSLFRPDLPYVVALGDTQIGKLENPTEELLQRVMDLMAKAVQPLELHKVSTGTLAKHAHLPWLGDCIEGMNSQGGRLRWRTTLTVTEQVRILRRLMLYQAELVAPLAERVTIVSVPGNHDECHDAETELLTRDGWVRMGEYDKRSEVGTLNPSTHAFEWQAPTAWHESFYSGQMLEVKSRRHDLLVTLNHDMYFTTDQSATFASGEYPRGWTKGKPVDFMQYGTQLKTLHAARSWVGSAEAISIPPHVDSLGRTYEGFEFPDLKDAARLFGWYVAEGCVDVRGWYRTSISQSAQVHPEYYQEIVDLLVRLGLKPELKAKQVRFSNSRIGRWLAENFGHRGSEMRLPSFLKEWPEELLEVFLDTYMKGDGNRSGHTWTARSKSARLLDDLQEIAIKLGRRSNRHEVIEFPVRGTDYVGSAGGVYINDRPTAGVGVDKKRFVNYEGMVYCPTVPNGLVFTRRNGKVIVTGNSSTRDMDTRIDDSWAVEALNQVADALSYNEAAFGHVECYVPGPDEHAVVMDVGGTIVAHTHGHEHAHNKHFQYWSGQALGEQPMGRAQVWLQGHGHHLQYDESGHRKWLEVPALESKSVWWERKTGTSGSPGLVTFQLDKGELLNLSKLQPGLEVLE